MTDQLIIEPEARLLVELGQERGVVYEEEIVGLMTALELFAKSDEAEQARKYGDIAKAVAEGVAGVRGIEATVVGSPSGIPLGRLKFTDAKDEDYMIRIDRFMKSKDPPVYLDDHLMDEMVMQVNPFNLTNDDVPVIVERLKEAVR